MAILSECPICHFKQSVKNKLCRCGENLDQAKRSKKVKYHINYRLQNGKQRREYVGSFAGLNGFSIEDARICESKRKTQKKENRLLDIKQDSKMTFNELTEWYLDLERVKSLAYCKTLKLLLKSFNSVFGDTIIRNIKPSELENFQIKQKKKGLSPSYIDQQIGAARTMINRGVDNDLLSSEALSAFRKVKKLLKRNGNARDRVLSKDEYNSILTHLPRHLKPVFATGYYTGMRKSEILSLTWDKVSLKDRLIRLEAEDTKDKEARNIPISDELYKILKGTPRALHDKHLFQYAGKPFKDIREGLINACKEAGVIYGRNKRDGFTFHDLRHTFNTNMRKAGVQESVIMEITGHSTREMFDRYNTIDQDDTRKAMKQLEVFFQFVDQTVDQDDKLSDRL